MFVVVFFQLQKVIVTNYFSLRGVFNWKNIYLYLDIQIYWETFTIGFGDILKSNYEGYVTCIIARRSSIIYGFPEFNLWRSTNIWRARKGEAMVTVVYFSYIYTFEREQVHLLKFTFAFYIYGTSNTNSLWVPLKDLKTLICIYYYLVCAFY